MCVTVHCVFVGILKNYYVSVDVGEKGGGHSVGWFVHIHHRYNLFCQQQLKSKATQVFLYC